MAGAHRPQRRPDGIELIVPDWFYKAVLDDALVLTIDRAYFDLTGGLDRWLYRIVRKHGGRQRDGWRFDFRHLHQKSGSLSPFKRFAFELRDIVRRQPARLHAVRSRWRSAGARCSLSSRWRPVENLWTASCYREPGLSCHREPEARAIRNPNRP
jgi:plasmid replication initiation protein